MVAKWFRLSWAQRLVLLEATGYLIAALAAVHFMPFRWLAPRLGRIVPASDDRPVSSREQLQALQVGWAVTTVARYFPWDAKCLAQAVAGKWMLQRRGLPTMLYLGVDHGDKKWLEAHAWLRCGTEFVTGEPQHKRFKILAAFNEERS